MYWLALRPLPEPAPPGDVAAAPGQPEPALLADARTALGWWALRFTPRVSLQDDVVLLEVSGSERLFGGRRQLLVQVNAGDSRPLVQVRMAQGATALLALARLQVDATAGQSPDHLPLETLVDARVHLATLQRLGCQVWGDLRALPRGGVVRRFGAPLLDALDRAYGLKPEVYPWLVLPEVFDLPLELQAQVEAAPALLFAARRLLAQLQVWLQARHQGVLALELLWQMDARRDTATEGSLVVRTAMPTQDMAHLQRLLAENLERITLPAPVLYLRLRTVETTALSGATTSLLPDEQHKGDDLTHLLERLAARLGPQQVLRVMARADHRPENMQEWVPAAGALAGGGGSRLAGASTDGLGKKNGSSTTGRSGKHRFSARYAPGVSDALYPTWLLATPLKLAVRRDRPLYQGPLTLLAGPQRLEAAWWDVTLALRDYFLARSAQAGLLWIYRERLMTVRVDGDKPVGHWYLHGIFG